MAAWKVLINKVSSRKSTKLLDVKRGREISHRWRGERTQFYSRHQWQILHAERQSGDQSGFGVDRIAEILWDIHRIADVTCIKAYSLARDWISASCPRADVYQNENCQVIHPPFSGVLSRSIIVYGGHKFITSWPKASLSDCNLAVALSIGF